MPCCLAYSLRRFAVLSSLGLVLPGNFIAFLGFSSSASVDGSRNASNILKSHLCLTLQSNSNDQSLPSARASIQWGSPCFAGPLQEVQLAEWHVYVEELYGILDPGKSSQHVWLSVSCLNRPASK